MGVKWFDLSERGAKLERPRDAAGVYHLRLTLDRGVDVSALAPAAALGWIGSEANPGLVFTNYRKIDKLSEVVSALGSFFTEDVVVAGKTDLHKLKRGEVVQGFDSPAFDHGAGILPKLDQVRGDLASMPAEMRERIVARVAAAQKLAGVGPGADGATLFRGEGLRLWRDLTERFGIREASEAIVATVLLAESRGEDFDDAQDALWRASETGSGLPAVSGMGQAGTRSKMIVDHIARDHATFGDLDPSWTEDRFYRGLVGHVRGMYRMWDGASIDFSQDPDAAEAYGNRFLADPSIPMSWRHDAFHRVSLVLRASAAMVGVDPREMFAGQSRLIHLGKDDGGPMEAYHRAQVIAVEGQKIEVAAIKFSPFRAGAVAHEVGHGVDLSNRALLGADAIERLIGDTGVREHVSEMVGRATWASPQYAAYLLNPREIVARSFEGALANRAIAAGDPDFERIGGSATIGGEISFMPPPDLSQRFVVALREVVAEARERRLDAEQDHEPASYGREP